MQLDAIGGDAGLAVEKIEETHTGDDHDLLAGMPLGASRGTLKAGRKSLKSNVVAITIARMIRIHLRCFSVIPLRAISWCRAQAET